MFDVLQEELDISPGKMKKMVTKLEENWDDTF